MSGRQSEAMARVREHVESWRREHGGRGVRLPEVLWGEAVVVARSDGLAKTARALGLNQGRLKARVRVAQDEGGVGDGVKATFVEMGVGQLGGCRMVVEFVRRDGDRMRIDVTGPSVDVVGVSQAFWSRQP